MIGFELDNLTQLSVLPNGLEIGHTSYFDDVPEGNWFLLFFYPAAFTWVCPTELIELKNKFAEFERLKTSVWAISTDGAEVLQEWVKQAFESMPFYMVADRNRLLSHEFACLDELNGVSYRCTVLVDPGNEDRNGMIRYYSICDNNVGRNVDEILRLIEAFQTSDASDGQVAPCGWTPGAELITPGE